MQYEALYKKYIDLKNENEALKTQIEEMKKLIPHIVNFGFSGQSDIKVLELIDLFFDNYNGNIYMIKGIRQCWKANRKIIEEIVKKA